MREIVLSLRFLIAPVSTWERVRMGSKPAAVMEREWFYPLLSVAAASAFVQMFYGCTVAMALVRAVAVFAAFFLANVLCPILLSSILSRLQDEGKKPVSEREIRVFTMFNLSILVLVTIVQNLLPSPLIPLFIFPVYQLFLITKCADAFNVTNEEKKLVFVFGEFCVVLLVPLLIFIVLFQFMPQGDNL